VRLEAYLKLRGISENGWATETGIPQSVVHRVCKGRGCTLESAMRIMVATSGLVRPEECAPTVLERLAIAATEQT
jgi:predicted transcriptional regulator